MIFAIFVNNQISFQFCIPDNGISCSYILHHQEYKVKIGTHCVWYITTMRIYIQYSLLILKSNAVQNCVVCLQPFVSKLPVFMQIHILQSTVKKMEPNRNTFHPKNIITSTWHVLYIVAYYKHFINIFLYICISHKCINICSSFNRNSLTNESYSNKLIVQNEEESVWLCSIALFAVTSTIFTVCLQLTVS